MSILAFLHARLATALIAFALILAIWGSYQFIRHHAVSGGFRSSFLIMAGLTAVQGVLGAIELAAGTRPAQLLHIVYGIFATVFLPAVFTYAGRSNQRDREAVYLAAACWVVLVAYGRGLATGH